METIIVEIRIGITGGVSDFVLPAHVPVGSLLKEIVRLVEQIIPEITFGEEMPVLCDLQTGRILSADTTLAQAGVRDSSRLLLA